MSDISKARKSVSRTQFIRLIDALMNATTSDEYIHAGRALAEAGVNSRTVESHIVKFFSRRGIMMHTSEADKAIVLAYVRAYIETVRWSHWKSSLNFNTAKRLFEDGYKAFQIREISLKGSEEAGLNLDV